MDDLQPLLALFRRWLPVAVPGGNLALADASSVRLDEGKLVVVLRTISHDDDGRIIDMREQDVVVGTLAEHPLDRWLAYLEGVLRSAPAIVESLGGLDAMLPFEVFMYAQVLDDPALVSADEFAAVLSNRERLTVWNQAMREQEWRDELEPLGLVEQGDAVVALRRPSLRLHIDPLDGDEEDDREIGRTRFGGDPDLPPEMDWPSAGGEPMIFVAQFDLAELAGFAAARELPREGLLSFFYTPFPRESVLEHPVAVLHLRDIDGLVRRFAPEPRDRLVPHAIELDEEELYPALESSFCFESLLPDSKLMPWFESLARGRAETPAIPDAALARFVYDHSSFDPCRPMHRLLGHPASIQGDPYLDVEMAARGWGEWREGTPEALALRRRALGWRLLLQVDADEGDVLSGTQDGGFFYFWIPADALAAHDWGRARGCLQCH